ncbi:MAG: serpin family protein [Cyclobacteriaceae bacterium]|nr:serpin family protein [Cyclobacteriaceae bacterium]
MVNAFGLNTSWTNGSYFNGSGSFNTWNGKETIIPTVNLGNTYAGISNELGIQFLEFGLKDENLRFSTIQLQSSEMLENLLENLTAARLDNLAKNARYAFTNLSLPAIPAAEKISLKPVLSSHGLSSVFSQGADLSPSFNSTNRSVSAMEQTAMLHFSQPELQSSEFTNSDLQLKAINLPFLYFVTEKQTGSILFAGYYLSPAE